MEAIDRSLGVGQNGANSAKLMVMWHEGLGTTCSHTRPISPTSRHGWHTLLPTFRSKIMNGIMPSLSRAHFLGDGRVLHFLVIICNEILVHQS